MLRNILCCIIYDLIVSIYCSVNLCLLFNDAVFVEPRNICPALPLIRVKWRNPSSIDGTILT